MSGGYSHLLKAACLSNYTREPFNRRTWSRARRILAAMRSNQQIPLLSQRDPDFDQTEAYQVSAAICIMRLKNQRRMPVGRKIGFTNTKIWSEYNVAEPNWGYIWNTSVFPILGDRTFYLDPSSAVLQPRIEPEIVFRLKSPPHSSMSEIEALSCIQWIAHGFEVVHSIYKDWNFTAPDTTAANALHRGLILGIRYDVGEKDLETWSKQLQDFNVDLYHNQDLVELGAGVNVLGGPIKALLHLCKMLESQTFHPQLTAGELISTGTLTRAMPISINERWSTKLRGIDLHGLDIHIKDIASSELLSTLTKIKKDRIAPLRKVVAMKSWKDVPLGENGK